ncbi:MAG: nucleotidyltransferase family protein [Zoogloeaceae bacterium]|jgi:MurNAc alpha-1-phosphate uridylyltransferase|nr:nucleotidyltransferase family protein [Zoogloeaceae bacterium]
MRAMILAAGRGERMRPLTDHTPKPLLLAGGKPLIVWHLEKLARVGIRQVVINTAHLGEQLPAALGTGARWGLEIFWSPEPPGALETAGGIAHALPYLGDAPFLVLNGDVFCDWEAFSLAGGLRAEALAHLLLVENPPHHPTGDFVLREARVENPSGATGEETLTFAGIGFYTPALFATCSGDRPAKLAPLLRAAADAGKVSGERHHGEWVDVGTPERLRALDEVLSTRI